MPRSVGHREGVKNITPVVTAALEYGVKCVTLYAFSTENKGRDKAEVDALVDLIRKRLKPMTRELIARGAGVVFTGDTTYFPEDVRKIMSEIEEESAANRSQTVNIALNYGGREEILRAAAYAVKCGEINAENFERGLYTSGLPELDMVIRTGGEKRLSNFLLYQAAYSELFFTETLWPDFDKAELMSMLDEYAHRTRKFGK